MAEDESKIVIERITKAFATAFAIFDLSEIRVIKNQRRFLETGLWELFFNHLGGKSDGTTGINDLLIQLQGQNLSMIGLSFSITSSNKMKMKFDFFNDLDDPIAAMSGGKVTGSVFYEREDRTIFSIDADITGYSIAELVTTKRDEFLSALENSRHANATPLGALEATGPSQTERTEIMNLARECMEIAEKGLAALSEFIEVLSRGN